MGLTRRWQIFLLFAFLAGVLLRFIWAGDIEYKFDEDYMFKRLLLVGNTEPFPLIGVASSIHLRNPGMSVWVFLAIGKLFNVHNPIEFAQAVEFLNVLALLLLAFFVLKVVKYSEREPWLWAFVLVAVNPFAVMYQRKIWAQSILPFFMMILLFLWWKRQKAVAAFFWGLLSLWVAQIHMSGFFFTASFILWVFLFDRQSLKWKPWLLGSLLGSISMIPWIVYFFTERPNRPMVFGLNEAFQFKYWVFWMTDPIGLHLGNPLGVHHGNSMFAQLADFFRYPFINGRASHLVAILHVGLVGLFLAIILSGFRQMWRKRNDWKELIIGRNSETAFTQNAALFGYGLLITAATVAIKRFYLIITFPLEFVWTARMALARDLNFGRKLLFSLFICELLLTISFLGFIHVNNGSPRGDYGPAYRIQKEARQYLNK